MNRGGTKNDKAINHKAPKFLLCHSLYMFRRHFSVHINFPTWDGNWRNCKRKYWIGIKIFLRLFHWPYFDISAVHMLTEDLNNSMSKFISKAEREKKKTLVCILAGIRSKHNHFFQCAKHFRIFSLPSHVTCLLFSCIWNSPTLLCMVLFYCLNCQHKWGKAKHF